MAVNTTWYMSSAGYAAIPVWTTGAARTVGQRVRATGPAINNERVFMCITAGSSHASTEPTWVNTKGGKTTDNTVTWQEVTGQPAANGDAANTPLSSAVRSTSPGLGQIIRNNSSTHFFIVSTQAAACGGSEPTFNTGTGATTTDGGVTWTCIGAVGAFAAWAAPHARMTPAVAAGWAALGDTIYVSSTHAETQPSAISVAAGGSAGVFISLICVAVAGSFPPTAADVTTGASVSTTGASNLTVNGSVYCQGIAFNAGTGAVSAGVTVGGSTGNYQRFENCSLNMVATSGVNFILGATRSRVELINTPITLSGAAVAAIQVLGHVVWRDTPNAIASSAGTWSTSLFLGTSGTGNILLENVDLSAGTGIGRLVDVSSNSSVRFTFNKCKLPAGVAITNMTGNSPASPVVDVINCDSGAGTYRHSRDDGIGRHAADATLVRSSGASDGTTAYSWRYTTGTTPRWAMPFESIPIAIWNPTTGANVDVALEGIWNAAAVPNNDDIWLEAVYAGTAGSTLGRRKTNTKASALAAAAALPASTEAWDSQVTARANGAVYALGDPIKTASNPGRVFFCTTAGAAAGSEPAGYASAIDGGSVADGAATFRAGCRFRLVTTLTGPQPQAPGYVNCVVRVGRASAQLYVDPLPVLS
jgi:hypothetical protein